MDVSCGKSRLPLILVLLAIRWRLLLVHPSHRHPSCILLEACSQNNDHMATKCIMFVIIFTAVTLFLGKDFELVHNQRDTQPLWYPKVKLLHFIFGIQSLPTGKRMGLYFRNLVNQYWIVFLKAFVLCDLWHGGVPR